MYSRGEMIRRDASLESQKQFFERTNDSRIKQR